MPYYIAGTPCLPRFGEGAGSSEGRSRGGEAGGGGGARVSKRRKEGRQPRTEIYMYHLNMRIIVATKKPKTVNTRQRVAHLKLKVSAVLLILQIIIMELSTAIIHRLFWERK